MMPRAAGSVGAVGSVRAAGSVGAVGGARSARRSPAPGGGGQECAEVTRAQADGARSARRSPGLGRAGPGQTRASVHEVRVAFLSFDDT